jgi:predicted ATPase
MFRIEAVSSPRVKLRFGRRTDGLNQISVITGPNGSGKTELLTTIANWFSNPARSELQTDTSVEWVRVNQSSSTSSDTESTGPSRVIAQTFSPFSRFASPAETRLTLTDVYADAAEHTELYRAIGIHRASRHVGGTLAKRTIEQGIFRLTEDPEQARNFGFVLEALGFSETIDFSYRKYPAAGKLIKAFGNGTLRQELSNHLPRPGQRVVNALQREMQRAGIESFAGLLESVLALLRHRLVEPSIDFTFDCRYGRPSEDYAVMQGLTFLRRLSLLRLASCQLFPLSQGRAIDLADASSGQQQMLCSLFGLQSELTSDSLVLIDEPELSLHPTWQMDFLDRLSKVLDQFEGCHVIVATHSPLIVQSALLKCLEVVQLRPEQEGTAIEPLSPADTLPQYGERASVEGTLLDVFGTPVSGSAHLANEIFDIVTEGESGDLTSREAALARLRKLEKLYSRREGVSSNQDGLSIISKAIALVSELDDDEGDVDGI